MSIVPGPLESDRSPRPSAGPEVLQVAERPASDAASGEVLVRVAAAGVNLLDATQRLGLYPPPPGAPTIPGREIADTVVEVR